MPLGHLGPLPSLSPASYVGQCLVTQFPHPFGEKAELLGVSMLLPTAYRMEGDKMDPKEIQSLFHPGYFMEVLSNLLGSSRAQSCHPRAVVLPSLPSLQCFTPKSHGHGEA